MAPKPPRSVSRPRRGNLGNQAAARLRDAIYRGEYAVGQPLREVELCRSLGISRIPLREAFHRLEGEGLVEIRPNRGAVVAGLSRTELIEVAEICRLLEGHLLRLSVPVLTNDVLDRAEAFVELLEEVDDLAEWSRINWKFHTALYSGAQRPHTVELLTAQRGRAERAMFLLIADKKRRLALNREHRSILACVRAGRTAKAALLLDAHLKGSKEEVLRLIETK